jgi:ribosomal protein L36
MLAMLSAEARAEMEVLAAICPIGVQVKGGKAMAGCLGCPSQSGPDPERLPRVAPPDASLVEPHAHVAGAFTKPGADEHLVMMDSCSCNGCLDEAYLLHREAGGFEVKAKAQVRSSSNCRVVRRRGQVDRPICDRFLARQGYAATTLEMYDFSNLPAEDGSELSPVFGFVALDDLSLSCAPGARFLRRALTSWQLTDVDRDGQDDLVVDLAVGDGVVNRAVFAICAAEEGEAPAKGLPTMRNVKLTWTATASGFRPTAATAAQLKQLDAAKNKAQPQLGE